MLFTLATPEKLSHRPGQFLMAGIPGYGEAPISISSPPYESDTIELCVRAVGSVTNAMHRLMAGEKLWVRGPYGNGFDTEALEGRDIVFVTGGIGLVPTRSLIKQILSERDRYGRLTLIYGVKTPGEILFADEIEKWRSLGVDVCVTVDKPHPDWDGSVGVVTIPLKEISIDAKKTSAVVVGPPVMYRFVILGLKEKFVDYEHVYLSLERRMKCGLGKCGHCQISSSYACQEGPVYRVSEIGELFEAL